MTICVDIASFSLSPVVINLKMTVFHNISVIFLHFQPQHVLKLHFKGENDGKNYEKMMMTTNDNDDDKYRH